MVASSQLKSHLLFFFFLFIRLERFSPSLEQFPSLACCCTTLQALHVSFKYYSATNVQLHFFPFPFLSFPFLFFSHFLFFFFFFFCGSKLQGPHTFFRARTPAHDGDRLAVHPGECRRAAAAHALCHTRAAAPPWPRAGRRRAARRWLGGCSAPASGCSNILDEERKTKRKTKKRKKE